MFSGLLVGSISSKLTPMIYLETGGLVKLRTSVWVFVLGRIAV